MKWIISFFILITSSTYALTTYDLPESTQLKKSPQESTEEFQNRVFATGMIKDLRTTLNGESLNRFTSCVKSSSPFMKNVSLEAISILCYHTGLDRVDTGVDYMFTPNKLTIVRYNKPKSNLVTESNPLPSSLSYSPFNNPCREMDHNNKGIVQFSPPYEITNKMQKYLEANPDINGRFIKNAFPKELAAQIQNEFKSYGVSMDTSFIYIKNNRPVICIECPANSAPNGYTCIRGECKLFDPNCNQKLDCGPNHIQVGETCVESCRSQCNKKLEELKNYYKYIFNPTAHIPYFHLINFLNIPKAHAILMMMPRLDGLTDQEVKRYSEVRERIVRRLESQILQALSKCDDTPDKDLCSKIPTLLREDVLSDQFRTCKERGGLANREGICEPEVCYTCPSAYYYDGPTAIAGCSARETEEAVSLTLSRKNDDKRCINGACVRKAISESEVRQTLARLGISCIRTTPARSAPPVQNRKKLKEIGSGSDIK